MSEHYDDCTGLPQVRSLQVHRARAALLGVLHGRRLMTAPTYGLCTHCRMWYALRPSGVIRRHRDGPVVCAGSKKAPESGDVGAAAIQAHATRQPIRLSPLASAMQQIAGNENRETA